MLKAYLLLKLQSFLYHNHRITESNDNQEKDTRKADENEENESQETPRQAIEK
jgi:hypothetical protein